MPVSQVELKHGISSGVRLRALGNSLVPLYEEHECRLERNISVENWSAMDEWEKAIMIASRRTRIAIANLQAEAEIEHSQKQARKK